MAEERSRPSRTAARRTGTRTAPVKDAEDAALRAARSLSKLIDHRPDGCSGVTRGDDDGWRVCVDVVEVPRIPDTTSLLATYEVDLGADGALRGYRRVRRYRRGAADQ
ncbi:gas vesicle protein GvpO [Streptomyces sp. NRRL F-5123]|uniref:gas vesicle protein GvpO n=1 Tax=Streptomyces sp. NRRL F-5123 TaxID=1463856 RepID=UPI0004E2688D|nr:gas vesicle protein GvpO [Streptomyces sp. NRRL F-5123]